MSYKGLKVNIIVAIADNLAIGRDNALLWHISEDLKYFKATTLGCTVIMGRRTFQSIGRPLPGRRNIVVTRDPSACGLGSASGIACAASLESALDMAVSSGEEQVFILGGGQIYAASMEIADRLYLTRVHTVIQDADTFFPAPDSRWRTVSSTEACTDPGSGLVYHFETLER